MDDKEKRDFLRKQEEKELRDIQKDASKSPMISAYQEIDDDVKLVKRYTPIVGVGSFICTGCIIDSAKNIIGIENPEILQINTHEDESEEMVGQAFACLVKIIEAKKPLVKMFIVDPQHLQENKAEGVLFLGVTLSEMKEDETRANFFERVKQEFMSLGLMKDKVDEDMTEEDNLHYQESFTVNYLTDVCVNYTEQTNKDDIDDHEIGYDEGRSDGIDEHYYMIQLALYKMFKGKKIKSLSVFLDELHNTIEGMDSNDMTRYGKAYQKWLKKEKKREIEGDL